MCPNNKEKETSNYSDKISNEQKKLICFVIMPISDVERYPTGHFRAIYDYIFKEACVQANFEPIRADEVLSSNMIQGDIIRKLFESDMVLCDLSDRNPNVLYELGFRQAFKKPVTLVQDDKTESIFDVSPFRYVSYRHERKIEDAQEDIQKIKEALLATYDSYQNNGNDINSPLQFLNSHAEIPKNVQLNSKSISMLVDSLPSLMAMVNTMNQTQNIMLNRLGISKDISSSVKNSNDEELLYRSFRRKIFDLYRTMRILKSTDGDDIEKIRKQLYDYKEEAKERFDSNHLYFQFLRRCGILEDKLDNILNNK